MRLTPWNCPPFKVLQQCFPGFNGFKTLLTTLVIVSVFFFTLVPTALANLDDDRFDGNIFALYGGNGSLVPPRVTLAESRRQGRPALLVFFLDDSKDCKKFTTTVSELQRFYGRSADFIPVNVDTLLPDTQFSPQEPGYYYKGYVPQTVLIDQSGKVVLDQNGQVAFERVDDVFRQVFDLLPRSESVELRRRSFNEFNTELVETQR
ncbi:thylakoid membrane photosystem I accumulation factor [Planktothrix mougeotii]|uniref:Thylakoid membrane photosystem I accumulation factor n=1 Tax=Planktothrix mougeotii LEGE 06226 TaxID=1828728 RepID=A0ABR9U8I7_9CYAN|nr:thylakoid membrane photosystem I accumulation factor [Planktothrix mougeotii]MBE9142778.1 thylakoid membrane photosystem I accumulation factor [Planktothrix mougeotii LEGE 06226]